MNFYVMPWNKIAKPKHHSENNLNIPEDSTVIRLWNQLQNFWNAVGKMLKVEIGLWDNKTRDHLSVTGAALV